MRRRFPAIHTAWGNARLPDEQLANIEKEISESDLIVFSTIVRLVSGQDALSFPESHRVILEKLAAAHKPVIWIAFGNPYVLRFAPQIGTYMCAFSYAEASQVAAAKALAGEIEISGRMPVSILEISRVGDGLTIPRLEMILKAAPSGELSTWEKTFEKTTKLVASLVENREMPGAELIVGHNGAAVLNMAIGKTGDSGDSANVSPNSVYDLDSLSGIVGTSSAAMLAADSGNLVLDAPVKDYIPEIGETDAANLPVPKLFLALKDTGKFGTEEINEAEDILQKIVSRTTGITFERFLVEHLFEQLGMKNTFLNRPQNFRGGIALTSSARRDKLFSNSRDVAVFAQMLLNRGVYNHHRFFKPETLARFKGPEGPWSKPSDSSWTGKLFSPAAFGYNCPTGSFVWIDPMKKLFIVLLTNGAGNKETLSEIQREISESIIAALSGL
jgi:CubicO group peptidase (beta-lactamase class C family)